jgi:hypothetical protein
MATAAPHVKLLRQLASAKDDYLSGAFDISWDGAKATLYLVFGRPSHAVFETDQAVIEGEAAIDALLAALPRAFVVSDWRRAMSPHETLSITIDELAGPFVRLAGSYADDPVVEEDPEWWSAVDDAPDLPFGLGDFPLLPGGRPLWVEASPDEVHLADRLADLPPSILILTGAKLRAAAVVSGGDLIDAVWLDSDDHARGETAGMALLGATKGSLAGYALDDPRVAEALTMLWRLPVAVSGVELSWLDPASMLAAFRADGLDRVLVVDAPVRGIALFSRGGLVAVYSETQRSAVASPERLRSLLSQARGRLTVMERKPRPIAAEAAPAPLNAHDFFEVAPVETAAVATEPAAASDTETLESTAVAAATDTETAESTVDAAEPAAAYDTETVDTAVDEAAATAVTADAAAETVAEPEPTAAVALTDDAPPPPPPPDESVVAEADAEPPPPPPAPEAAEPTKKAKRSRWGFGRSRKSRAEKQAVDEALAGVSELSTNADGDAASFEGWSVRQPSETPQPVWMRSHIAEDGTSVPADPPADTEEAEEPATPSWSVAQRDGDPEPAADVAATNAAPAVDAAPSVAEDGTDPTAPLETALQADFTHHGLDAKDHAIAPPDEPAHHFDFVSLDDPAAEADPEPQAAAESWASSSWLDDVVHGTTTPEPGDVDHVAATSDGAHAGEAEADTETETVHPSDPAGASAPAHAASSDTESLADTLADADATAGEHDADHAAETRPVLHTPGPWSWPLAEPDENGHPSGGTGATPLSWDDSDDLEPAAVPASGHGDAASASADGAEPGFFHRDEPVGSQYVDFDEVRNELVQIGIVWLGETNAVQVTALLSNTRSTIDDFVATIDTIRGLHLDGQDPASIQAMAREMHQQAAERLCGA